MRIIETLVDKRKFAFEPKRDAWIPHQYEETKQYDTFFGFNPEWTVVDVGGWVGLWMVWVAPYVKKVYVIEPVPEFFDTLTQNVKLNNFANVELFNFALFSKTGSAEMDKITVAPVASTLIRGAWGYGAEWLYEGATKMLVPCLTWDDWVEKHDITEINLFKMDVEGAELDVLSKMTKVLPERISIAVYHIPSPFPKIFNVLTEKGYILDGLGYYDKHAKNKGKPHSGFFRRKDIPFQTHQTYTMQEYELPTKEEMDAGIPFYWGKHK